jgi:hypothetical protein
LMCIDRHLKNGHHSHNFFRILPNFERKLEIPNIMLVCMFEINWSTNKNLRALTTYLGQTDSCYVSLCSEFRVLISVMIFT